MKAKGDNRPRNSTLNKVSGGPSSQSFLSLPASAKPFKKRRHNLNGKVELSTKIVTVPKKSVLSSTDTRRATRASVCRQNGTPRNRNALSPTKRRQSLRDRNIFGQCVARKGNLSAMKENPMTADSKSTEIETDTKLKSKSSADMKSTENKQKSVATDTVTAVEKAILSETESVENVVETKRYNLRSQRFSRSAGQTEVLDEHNLRSTKDMQNDIISQSENAEDDENDLNKIIDTTDLKDIENNTKQMLSDNDSAKNVKHDVDRNAVINEDLKHGPTMVQNDENQNIIVSDNSKNIKGNMNPIISDSDNANNDVNKNISNSNTDAITTEIKICQAVQGETLQRSNVLSDDNQNISNSNTDAITTEMKICQAVEDETLHKSNVHSDDNHDESNNHDDILTHGTAKSSDVGKLNQNTTPRNPIMNIQSEEQEVTTASQNLDRNQENMKTNKLDTIIVDKIKNLQTDDTNEGVVLVKIMEDKTMSVVEKLVNYNGKVQNQSSHITTATVGAEFEDFNIVEKHYDDNGRVQNQSSHIITATVGKEIEDFNAVEKHGNENGKIHQSSHIITATVGKKIKDFNAVEKHGNEYGKIHQSSHIITATVGKEIKDFNAVEKHGNENGKIHQSSHIITATVGEKIEDFNTVDKHIGDNERVQNQSSHIITAAVGKEIEDFNAVEKHVSNTDNGKFQNQSYQIIAATVLEEIEDLNTEEKHVGDNKRVQNQSSHIITATVGEEFEDYNTMEKHVNENGKIHQSSHISFTYNGREIPQLIPIKNLGQNFKCPQMAKESPVIGNLELDNKLCTTNETVRCNLPEDYLKSNRTLKKFRKPKNGPPEVDDNLGKSTIRDNNDDVEIIFEHINTSTVAKPNVRNWVTGANSKLTTLDKKLFKSNDYHLLSKNRMKDTQHVKPKVMKQLINNSLEVSLLEVHNNTSGLHTQPQSNDAMNYHSNAITPNVQQAKNKEQNRPVITSKVRKESNPKLHVTITPLVKPKFGHNKLMNDNSSGELEKTSSGFETNATRVVKEIPRARTNKISTKSLGSRRSRLIPDLNRILADKEKRNVHVFKAIPKMLKNLKAVTRREPKPANFIVKKVIPKFGGRKLKTNDRNISVGTKEDKLGFKSNPSAVDDTNCCEYKKSPKNAVNANATTADKTSRNTFSSETCNVQSSKVAKSPLPSSSSDQDIKADTLYPSQELLKELQSGKQSERSNDNTPSVAYSHNVTNKVDPSTVSQDNTDTALTVDCSHSIANLTKENVSIVTTTQCYKETTCSNISNESETTVVQKTKKKTKVTSSKELSLLLKKPRMKTKSTAKEISKKVICSSLKKSKVIEETVTTTIASTFSRKKCGKKRFGETEEVGAHCSCHGSNFQGSLCGDTPWSRHSYTTVCATPGVQCTTGTVCCGHSSIRCCCSGQRDDISGNTPTHNIPHIEMAFPAYLYDSPTRSNSQPVIADFMDYKVTSNNPDQWPHPCQNFMETQAIESLDPGTQSDNISFRNNVQTVRDDLAPPSFPLCGLSYETNILHSRIPILEHDYTAMQPATTSFCSNNTETSLYLNNTETSLYSNNTYSNSNFNSAQMDSNDHDSFVRWNTSNLTYNSNYTYNQTCNTNHACNSSQNSCCAYNTGHSPIYSSNSFNQRSNIPCSLNSYATYRGFSHSMNSNAHNALHMNLPPLVSRVTYSQQNMQFGNRSNGQQHKIFNRSRISRLTAVKELLEDSSNTLVHDDPLSRYSHQINNNQMTSNASDGAESNENISSSKIPSHLSSMFNYIQREHNYLTSNNQLQEAPLRRELTNTLNQFIQIMKEKYPQTNNEACKKVSPSSTVEDDHQSVNANVFCNMVDVHDVSSESLHDNVVEVIDNIVARVEEIPLQSVLDKVDMKDGLDDSQEIFTAVVGMVITETSTNGKEKIIENVNDAEQSKDALHMREDHSTLGDISNVYNQGEIENSNEGVHHVVETAKINVNINIQSVKKVDDPVYETVHITIDKLIADIEKPFDSKHKRMSSVSVNEYNNDKDKAIVKVKNACNEILDLPTNATFNNLDILDKLSSEDVEENVVITLDVVDIINILIDKVEQNEVSQIIDNIVCLTAEKNDNVFKTSPVAESISQIIDSMMEDIENIVGETPESVVKHQKNMCSQSKELDYTHFPENKDKYIPPEDLVFKTEPFEICPEIVERIRSSKKKVPPAEDMVFKIEPFEIRPEIVDQIRSSKKKVPPAEEMVFKIEPFEIRPEIVDQIRSSKKRGAVNFTETKFQRVQSRCNPRSEMKPKLDDLENIDVDDDVLNMGIINIEEYLKDEVNTQSAHVQTTIGNRNSSAQMSSQHGLDSQSTDFGSWLFPDSASFPEDPDGLIREMGLCEVDRLMDVLYEVENKQPNIKKLCNGNIKRRETKTREETLPLAKIRDDTATVRSPISIRSITNEIKIRHDPHVENYIKVQQNGVNSIAMNSTRVNQNNSNVASSATTSFNNSPKRRRNRKQTLQPTSGYGSPIISTSYQGYCSPYSTPSLGWNSPNATTYVSPSPTHNYMGSDTPNIGSNATNNHMGSSLYYSQSHIDTEDFNSLSHTHVNYNSSNITPNESSKYHNGSNVTSPYENSKYHNGSNMTPNENSKYHNGSNMTPNENSKYHNGSNMTPNENSKYHNGSNMTPNENSKYYNGSNMTPNENSKYYNGSNMTPNENSKYHNGSNMTPNENSKYHNGSNMTLNENSKYFNGSNVTSAYESSKYYNGSNIIPNKNPKYYNGSNITSAYEGPYNGSNMTLNENSKFYKSSNMTPAYETPSYIDPSVNNLVAPYIRTTYNKLNDDVNQGRRGSNGSLSVCSDQGYAGSVVTQTYSSPSLTANECSPIRKPRARKPNVNQLDDSTSKTSQGTKRKSNVQGGSEAVNLQRLEKSTGPTKKTKVSKATQIVEKESVSESPCSRSIPLPIAKSSGNLLNNQASQSPNVRHVNRAIDVSQTTADCVMVPCVYKVYGCKIHLPTSAMPDHEFYCKFQCIKCPTFKCKWYEPLLFYNDHVLSQHLQQVESSHRALFLIKLNILNRIQVFYQNHDPYIYIFRVKVMSTFIRGQVAFIRTPQHEHNHHYISLLIKSFGQVRHQMKFPIPVYLGDKEPYKEMLKDRRTRFLIRRSPSGQEPRFLELFSEIYVPEVTVNISADEKDAAERWLRDPSNRLAALSSTSAGNTVNLQQMSTSNQSEIPLVKPGPLSSKTPLMTNLDKTILTVSKVSDKSIRSAQIIPKSEFSSKVKSFTNAASERKGKKREMWAAQNVIVKKRGRPKKSELSRYLQLIRISKVKEENSGREKYKVWYTKPTAPAKQNSILKIKPLDELKIKIVPG